MLYCCCFGGFVKCSNVQSVAADVSISSYGPVTVQGTSSLTRTVAHIYTAMLVFPLISHIWQPTLDGQCWLFSCGGIAVVTFSYCTTCSSYMNGFWFLSAFSSDAATNVWILPSMKLSLYSLIGRKGCRRLRLPGFSDSRHMKMAKLSALHTGCLFISGRISGGHFC